jgi:hypothetical protein
MFTSVINPSTVTIPCPPQSPMHGGAAVGVDVRGTGVGDSSAAVALAVWVGDSAVVVVALGERVAVGESMAVADGVDEGTGLAEGGTVAVLGGVALAVSGGGIDEVGVTV